MNLIIDKKTNVVVWTNPDNNKLDGKTAFDKFDSKKHRILFSQDYTQNIGEIIPDNVLKSIMNEDIPPYQSKSVYDKITASERILFSWSDEVSETETFAKPLTNEFYQIFDGNKWIVNEKEKVYHLKEVKISEVEKSFSEKLENGFIYDKKNWQARYIDQQNLNTEISGWSIELPVSSIWRTRENENVQVTKDYLIQLAKSMKEFVLKTIQKRWALKLEIENSTSISELESIEIKF